MKRVDGLCTTLLHGTSRKMSSYPPQDPLVWRTCTDKPSWTSSQCWEVRCCYWHRHVLKLQYFLPVFANIPKLQALEEVYLFFCTTCRTLMGFSHSNEGTGENYFAMKRKVNVLSDRALRNREVSLGHFPLVFGVFPEWYLQFQEALS